MTCDIWTKINPDLNDANARCRGVVAEQSSKVIITGDVLIFSGNVSEQENTVGLLLFFALMHCLKLQFSSGFDVCELLYQHAHEN